MPGCDYTYLSHELSPNLGSRFVGRGRKMKAVYKSSNSLSAELGLSLPTMGVIPDIAGYASGLNMTSAHFNVS